VSAALKEIVGKLQDMLERAGVKVMLNELSSTVVFERPLEEPFVRKWQLACQVGLQIEDTHILSVFVFAFS